MRSWHRFIKLSMALVFWTSSAWGLVPEELQRLVFTGNMNGRSSIDFRSQARNFQSLVPKGTEATVLESRKLQRTGSYAVKVKVTKVGRNMGRTTAKEGEEMWVYYSQKRPWMKFKDKDSQTVQDPENALTALAQRDGEGLRVPEEGVVANPSLPTPEEVQRQAEVEETTTQEDPNLAKNSDRTQTEGSFCPNCPELRPATRAPTEAHDVIQIAERAQAGMWSDDAKVLNYSTSDKTKKMINYALRHKNRRSTGYCYRYVKKAGLAGGHLNKYPPGGHARDAVKDLRAQGFVNLLDDPKYKGKINSYWDAPKGAIIVAHNGTRASGDVVIKTDWGRSGGFVSDFYSPNAYVDGSPRARRAARAGQPYKIIGVMIAP